MFGSVNIVLVPVFVLVWDYLLFGVLLGKFEWAGVTFILGGLMILRRNEYSIKGKKQINQAVNP